MGYSSYSSSDRMMRASTEGFATKSVNQIFTQNVKREIHELMSPKGIKPRECFDSEAHPNTVPVQLYLDVTGSMGQIPHQMIKDGLPKLVGSLIQNGIKDVSLMFGAIGDHECDRVPLQVAQFESGDAELDMWLTRTYIEGNGGGNGGESYLLAWYFGANHVNTDSFAKRGKKGFIFTIGDEPTLNHLPLTAVKEIMGDSAVGQGTMTSVELLEKAKETNHVYHIHIAHRGDSTDRYVTEGWKNLIGENLIITKDSNEISSIISKIVLSWENNDIFNSKLFKRLDKEETKAKEEEIIL